MLLRSHQIDQGSCHPLTPDVGDFDIALSFMSIIPSVWETTVAQISEAGIVHSFMKTLHHPFSMTVLPELLLNMQDLIEVTCIEPREISLAKTSASATILCDRSMLDLHRTQ